MSADSADLALLWMDTTCRTAFPSRRLRLRFTGQPEIVRETHKAWHENLERKVRYALSNMMPDSTIKLDGIKIESYTTSSYNVVHYRVANRPVIAENDDDFEAAVCAVIEIAGGGT